MSTATATTATTAETRGLGWGESFGEGPGVPMSRLVRVELRKMLDTRAGAWLLGITAGLVVLSNAVALIIFAANDVDGVDYGTFISVTAYVAGLLLPFLGILLVTQEWGQRTGMVTFALVPHRGRVIAAKAAAGLSITLGCVVAGVVVGALMNLLYGAIQGPADWDLGATYLLGFIATQVIAMLAGFALATLLLNTPAAIILFVAYTFVLPTVFAVVAQLVGWFKDVQPWIDFQAAQGPLGGATMRGDDWGHLAVSGLIWLVVPLVLGVWRILRAEVK